MESLVRQTNKQTNKQTDRQTEKQTNKENPITVFGLNYCLSIEHCLNLKAPVRLQLYTYLFCFSCKTGQKMFFTA